MTLVARHAALTDIGLHRTTNEDSHAVEEPLFVVADGMGGAQAGEVASRTAVETLVERLAAGVTMAEAAAEANRRIFALAGDDEQHAGMGTTLTALRLAGERAEIVHVGDSRLYRLRDGSLEQLTVDHTMVGQWLRDGTMTEEQAAASRYRSVLTRALGTEEEVEIDSLMTDVQAGDRFLLCSDGLCSLVGEEVIADILGQGAPEVVARELVREAKNSGGFDNITVIVVRMDEEGAGGGAPAPADEDGDGAAAGDEAPSAGDDTTVAAGHAETGGGSAAGATPSVMAGIVEAPVARARSRRRRRALIAFLILVLVALVTLAVLLATGVVDADQLGLGTLVVNGARP